MTRINPSPARRSGAFSVLVPLTLLAISACASSTGNNEMAEAEAKPDPRRGEEVNKICFNRSIDNFNNTSKNSVVLRTGPSNEYLVEVRGNCFQLRRAQRIAIDSALSCVTRNDILIVSDSAFRSGSDLGPDRCFISKIYKWNKNAEPEEASPESGN